MTSRASSASALTWVVFRQPGEEILAFPSDAVVRIGRAPPPTPMPFAPPVIDGLIGQGGGIVPLVSLAALLRPDDAGSAVAPGGDMIVVRSAGSLFALRVGRVLFTAAADDAAAAAEQGPADEWPAAVPLAFEKVLTLRGRRVGCLAVDRLGLAALAAWQPPAGDPGSVADARQAAAAAFDDTAARRRQTIIAVRAGGEVYGLPSTVVAEMLDGPVPVTRLPLVPPIVSGIAVLAGAALAVFSLARLLGLDEEARSVRGGDAAPLNHVAVRVGDGRLLLAVDRILGLHHLPTRRRVAASLDGVVTDGGLRVRRVLEVSELIEPKMLAMVAGIGRAEARRREQGVDRADGGRAYLSLTVGGRLCALALDSVERIVEPPRHPVRLPDGAPEGLHGAVSVAGEILPLTDGARWLRLLDPAKAAAPMTPAPSPAATACIILRSDAGRHALVAEAVHRIVRISDRSVFPADDPAGRIMAVGEIEGRSALILATSRLMAAAPGAVE